MTKWVRYVSQSVTQSVSYSVSQSVSQRMSERANERTYERTSPFCWTGCMRNKVVAPYLSLSLSLPFFASLSPLRFAFGIPPTIPRYHPSSAIREGRRCGLSPFLPNPLANTLPAAARNCSMLTYTWVNNPCSVLSCKLDSNSIRPDGPRRLRV